MRLLGRSDPPSCDDSLTHPSALDPLGKQMCLRSNVGRHLVGTWGQGDGHHSTVGRRGFCGSPVRRILVRWERGPPASPWHACSSALPSAVCQLCPFPDPTLGEILRSCLNHFLSRPHFQLWESGPGQQPGAFCTLPMGSYPLSSSFWPGPFFDFIGS